MENLSRIIKYSHIIYLFIILLYYWFCVLPLCLFSMNSFNIFTISNKKLSSKNLDDIVVYFHSFINQLSDYSNILF